MNLHFQKKCTEAPYNYLGNLVEGIYFMTIRITAQKSYIDHYNIEQSFENSTFKLSDAIREVHEHAVISDSRCLTKSSDIKGCRSINYMITITVDLNFESEVEVIEIAQDLRQVIKLYGWTIFNLPGGSS